MDDMMAKQIKLGLKGIAADIQGLLLGVLAGGIVGVAAIGLVIVFVTCLYVLVARLARSNFVPDSLVILAGVVVGLGLITVASMTIIRLRRTLPEWLVKRGQAYEREEKAQQARERLAAQGAYTDPRKNKSSSSERK